MFRQRGLVVRFRASGMGKRLMTVRPACVALYPLRCHLALDNVTPSRLGGTVPSKASPCLRNNRLGGQKVADYLPLTRRSLAPVPSQSDAAKFRRNAVNTNPQLDEETQSSRLLRKKSGEVVWHALRSPRRHSLPGPLTRSKSVHIDIHADIRQFIRLEKPLVVSAVSAGSSSIDGWRITTN
jgi:hypothetical protein